MVLSRTWSGWFLRRCIEALVYTVITLSAEYLFYGNDFSFSQTLHDLKLIAALLATYGLVLLYLPISGIAFYFSKKANSMAIYFEAAVFVIHSILALSLMYSQIFGLSTNIDYSTPIIIGWFAVVLLQVLFVTGTFLRETLKKDSA